MSSAPIIVSGPPRWVRHLAVVCVLAAGMLVHTAAPGYAKYASLVMDADTGQVLHEVNADTRNYPASLTKMMTLYLVFEALENGRWTLDRRLKVSARAARQPSSKLALRRGQTITVEDAVMAIVTKSANDVAAAIAENMNGSERNFALVMTKKARDLGMSRTTFRNASGLPHRGQTSTARDMATLARALITDFPSYYHYFSAESFVYKGTRHRNHNKLLKSYNGADGIKTGYIRASGFNLVASAKRGNRRLIGVVFGGRSPRMRNRHMARLLDRGFKTFNPPTVMVKKKEQPKQPVTRTAATSPTPRRVANDPATDGQWGVQVGVYARTSQARKMAESVVAKAAEEFENGTVAVVPLRKKRRRKVLYRARVVGLSKKQAYEACDELERQRISCLEVMSRRGIKTASVAKPSRPKAPTVASTKAPAQPAKTRTAAKWGIQVGVYAEYDPAYAIAQKAAARVPSLMEDGHIKVVPLDRGRRKTYYRGRILGISKKLAYRACRILKRHKMSCMELRIKDDVQVALTER